jgi:hypothetical protein
MVIHPLISQSYFKCFLIETYFLYNACTRNNDEHVLVLNKHIWCIYRVRSHDIVVRVPAG